MLDASRLAFGATTVALVALASAGTAVLVSHGTQQLRSPNHFSAPRAPQELPGAGAPVVVPRFPGSLVLPPPPVTVPVTIPVDRPVIAPPQAPEPAQPPAVPEPPLVLPPLVTPPVVLPPPPVVEPRVKHPRKPHHDNGKHLGQLKHLGD